MKLATIAVILAVTACVERAAGDNLSVFASANADYSAGHFAEAISGYEQLVQSGKWSANLFYDLGNAYDRAGDFGRATLNYERALALDPKHPETQANLRLARDHGRALEIQRSAFERYFPIGTSSQFAIVSSAGFWIAVFAGVALFFARRRTALALVICAAGVIVAAVAGFAAYAIENGTRGRALAVVTAKNVQARLATADNSGTILALPPGSEVKILSTRGDWVYAALPNDLRGWIPASAAELVRM